MLPPRNSDALDTISSTLPAGEPTPDRPISVAAAGTGKLLRPDPAIGLFPPRQLGKYVIREALGRGAMGQVYAADDTQLHRRVAIKFVNRLEDEHGERLMLEARAAARLQHPNIATIYDVDRIDPGSASPAQNSGPGSLPYIVQEYISGQSLASLKKPMPWQRVYALGLALSRGLAAAHRAGVLHRDIKPANVMLSESGEPKIVDFGVAKLVKLSDIEHEGAASEHNATIHDARAAAASLTGHRAVVGTPYYMAPEVWRGEGASSRSDVYSFGVLLYELCTGSVPHRDVLVTALSAWVSEHDAPALVQAASDVDPRFAAVVDRCLARVAEERFASAEELQQALEELDLSGRKPILPDDNPYRGLLPFEAKHRGVFFGRDTSIREIAERLRNAPLLLVAGESGVGKSSLIHAGVLPYIVDYGLGDHRRWDVITLVPGKRPFSILMSELSRRLQSGKAGSMAEAVLASDLRQDPAALVHRFRRYHGRDRGTLICVDQLEELVTLADPEEATLASRALAYLIEHEPTVRVVATVRGDKITMLMRLPELAVLMDRALYFLRPLTAEEMHEAVVGPAAAKGVQFESEALVEALITATAHGSGGLPLLQFALSQLWHLRDKERGIIPAAALDDIGGVTGALSRHADRVLTDLVAPGTYEAARRILIRLVTAQDTRCRCSEDELAVHGDAHHKALDALVQGRLVVVRQSGGQPVYELAHEALIPEWSTLRRFLDEESGTRAAKERLRAAAAEWAETGKSREALWRGRRLREALELDLTNLPVEQEFVQLSDRAANRARWLIRLAFLAPVLLVVLVYGIFQYRQERAINQRVDRLIRESDAKLAGIPSFEQAHSLAREAPFERLRAGDMAGGEQLWRQALRDLDIMDAVYAQAILPLELALTHAPGRSDVRGRIASLIDAQAQLAQALGNHAKRDLLVQRLANYDDAGELLQRWTASIPVSLRTSPPGLLVKVYRYSGAPENSVPTPMENAATAANSTPSWALIDLEQDRSTPATWRLAPGSYLFTLEASDRTVAARYPLVIGVESRPQTAIDLELTVPEPGDVSEGFLYIPAGEFLFGYGMNSTLEPLRRWYQALPMHTRSTGAYWIARHETTYEEWLQYLDALPSEERAIRLPSGRDPYSETLIELTEVGATYEWHIKTSSYEYRAKLGEEIEYSGRQRLRRQRWWRFPVTGISGQDAQAYVTWLDHTGKVPGARLCREDEWERAARGADSRVFAHGHELWPEDANYDMTYPKEGLGLDEVGSHPRSASPFGLEDTVGNAREMAISITEPGRLVARGGAHFYTEHTNAVINREVALETQRLPYMGLRVCADVTLR